VYLYWNDWNPPKLEVVENIEEIENSKMVRVYDLIELKKKLVAHLLQDPITSPPSAELPICPSAD
jgi:hypothetical protein